MASTLEQTTSVRGRVTLEDVAKHVGIGRATVAHVMAGRADRLRIAKETQARVVRAASELGYVPNTAAKATAQGRVGRVALVVGSQGRTLSLGLVTKAVGGLSAHGMTLSIAEVPDAQLSSAEYMPRILQELSADGLIMAYNAAIPAEMTRVIEANRIPTVWVNAKRPHDCVHPDDLGAGRRATDVLLAAGHRRVAYLGFADADHYSAADRRAGYAAAMADAGLPPLAWSVRRRFFEPHDLAGDDRLAQVLALLAAPGRPTGVVTYERDAAMLLLVAAERSGLRVPRDLSIVTFHEGMPRDGGIAIETLQVPAEQMGAAAVEMVMRKVADRGSAVPSVAIPFAHVEGASVAPCAGR